MPLLTPPAIVSNFLFQNGYDINPNLLIIGENYPKPVPGQYFYRSIYPGFTGAGLNSFTRVLCNTVFNIPIGLENIMIHNFLNGTGIGGGRRLLIDALPDGVPPFHPISSARLNDLVTDINMINPNYIMIIHNNNSTTANLLLQHPQFKSIQNRLLINPIATVHPNIFPFFSGAARPIHFLNAIAAVRDQGINI